MNHSRSLYSAPLPDLYQIAHNGVVIAQAILVLLSPFIPLVGGPLIQDRAMDAIFAIYLCLIALRCVLDRPSFRLIAALTLVGAYAVAGLVESYMIHNLSGFIYEAKLLMSLALFFCLLDKRPVISDKVIKLLFFSFIAASCIFLVLNGGERLHLVNESNYLCLYIGVAMFSYISFKGKAISVPTIIGLGIFTLFVIVTSQSRTGAGFLAVTWLVYFYERFGFKFAVLASGLLAITGVTGAVAAVALNAPIVKRFEEFKTPSKVDRFIYIVEARKILKMRPTVENIIRLSYSKPVSTRVDAKMKWLTSKSAHGTEQGQLYPHHFHLAYLRILMGHGFIIFALYLIAIPLLWPINKYLSLGVAVCSLSMSVPYLSLFFGALHIAMAFPGYKSARQQRRTNNSSAQNSHSKNTYTLTTQPRMV